MSQLAIFTNFKPADLKRNPYLRRGEYAVWDANMHNGDLRPFACPQVICEESDAVTLYPLPECCCAGFAFCADPQKGFCQDQHFYIEDTKLMQATTDEVCDGGGCCAGAPKPPPPVAQSECVGCEDPFQGCYDAAIVPCEALKTEVDALEAAYFACKYACQESGNCEDEACDAEFEAWQSKLQEYNKCMSCQREAIIACYEADKPECPCDGIGYHYVIRYITSHAGITLPGPASAPSNMAVTNGHIPNATITWDDPPAGYCIVAVELYRVESEFEDGTTNMPIDGGEYVLVDTFPVGQNSFVDTVPTEDTGYPLIDYQAFPAPPAHHLARTEDGLVIADHCRVYISRPGEPMFTFDGIVSIDDRIRHIEAIGNTVFVFTDNYPVRIQFKYSEGIMSIDRVTAKRRAPLKSHASVAVYGERIYFASTHGYYAWDVSGYGADVKLVTQELFTPEQWKMIHAESVVATAFEFGIIMYSRGLGHGFMLEFGGDGTDTANMTAAMPLSARLLTAGVNPKLSDKGMQIEAMATTYDGHIVYRICGKVYGWDWRRDICRREIHEAGKGKDCCPWTVRLYYDSEGKNSFNVARWEFNDDSPITMKIQEGLCGYHRTIDEMEVSCSRGFGIRGYSSANKHWIEAESCAVAWEFRMATSYDELVSRTNQDIA